LRCHLFQETVTKLLDFTQQELENYDQHIERYGEIYIGENGWWITILGKRHGDEREVDDYLEYVIEMNGDRKWFVRESGIWDPAPQRVEKPFPLPSKIDIYTLLALYKLKGKQSDPKTVLNGILGDLPAYAQYFYLKMCMLVKCNTNSVDPIPTGCYETEKDLRVELYGMCPDLELMKEHVLSLA